MKRISLIFAILIFALRLPAQTNTPIRLALVSETDEASAAADVLTAELSSHKNLQLLERSEIEKVYREQSLSAGNKDYLKLGQILGADGLLLLDSVREGTNRFLMTRLVAAKPGVVIVDARSIWPAEAMSEWAAGFVDYLQPLFPKLTVLAKDAVPISVLNLRSALQTSGNQSIEKELTLLLIHRLTHQREVFVLERQHMGELAFEKELQQDESPFWTGRYLLDGVLDQDGFQNDRTKLNARLSSVKGGPLIQMEVTGSRTNLPAMVETLVGQILVALHEVPARMNGARWKKRSSIIRRRSGRFGGDCNEKRGRPVSPRGRWVCRPRKWPCCGFAVTPTGFPQIFGQPAASWSVCHRCRTGR